MLTPFNTLKSLPPLNILESYQPFLGPFELSMSGPLSQKYISGIAQVLVLMVWVPNLTLTFLTVTWPRPGPELDSFKYSRAILIHIFGQEYLKYLGLLDFLDYSDNKRLKWSVVCRGQSRGLTEWLSVWVTQTLPEIQRIQRERDRRDTQHLHFYSDKQETLLTNNLSINQF